MADGVYCVHRSFWKCQLPFKKNCLEQYNCIEDSTLKTCYYIIDITVIDRVCHENNNKTHNFMTATWQWLPEYNNDVCKECNTIALQLTVDTYTQYIYI